ncbi:MAG TPA: ATP-dependent DNA ligase [Candidatus Nitrosocosmicus sp.]|nr:ATP-dependent DNA ligase [Candidatus Nitrosocosmicus sp.]
MNFLELAEILAVMEKTTSRLELTDHLVSILKKTPVDIIDKIVYLIQGKLGPDYESSELGIADKLIIKSLSLVSGHSLAYIHNKYSEMGDLGEVAFNILTNKIQTTLIHKLLTIEYLYETLLRIANTSGSGSLDVKLRFIVSLLNNSSNLEAKFIVKLILGNLRLGIANFTLLDAIALSFTGDKKNRRILERAYNVSSDLGKIALILAKGSLEDIKAIHISLFSPVRPMLAERVSKPSEALEKINGDALAEFKIDGERIQIHKKGKKIELFTRSLENVTSNFPDILAALDKIDTKDLIAEGEVVAINPVNNKYLPFQTLMRRRRKYNIQEITAAYPVILNLFDLLYYNGLDKTHLTLFERRKLLVKIFGKQKTGNKITVIDQIKVSRIQEIENYTEKALKNGCEGIMLKNPSSQYRAGAREWAWMKLKKEYSGEVMDSVDLVIVGALYGKGRRVGKYGALLLATYDAERDVFCTICKVGTGFTDNVLLDLTDKLNKYIIKHKHSRVESGNTKMDTWFEPKIVLEIISPEITMSPVYTTAINSMKPGYGLALRFPKFTGKIREDKSAEDATTVKDIFEIYKNQLK